MFLARAYVDLTGWIMSYGWGQDKFTHTYVGLAIWLAIALLIRRPLSSTIPVLAVLAIELTNERIDCLAANGWSWSDTSRDIIATMFWPIVLMLALRLWPQLATGRRLD